MIRRTTWYALGVFFLVVSVTVYVQGRDEPLFMVDATPTPVISPILGTEFGEIVEMRIFGENGKTVTIAREEGKAWVLMQPAGHQISQEEVGNAISTLLTWTPLTSFSSSISLEQIGLAPPVFVLNLYSAVGNTVEKEIKIGNLTPTQSGYYVQLEDNPPVVVSKYEVELVTGLLNTIGPVDLTPSGP
jgi:hypothetical protein